MAKETVLIGCRLPNGLVLHHPKNRNLTVTLAGVYEAKTESGLYLPPKMFSTTPIELSSFKQKTSQGSWGTILFRPFLISQLLGV